MKLEELKNPSYTVKQTADIMGIHERTVMRMLEDGRLDGDLVETLRGKVWLISPLSIATMMVRKSDSGNKQYPRAETKRKD